MKPVLLPAAAALAVLIAGPAEAKQRPVWEVGIGAGLTYSPDYWGSDESSFGGFPLGYIAYRGEHFSFMPEGIYDVPADDTSFFSFSGSADFQGKLDPEDRLGLPEVDYVGEVGPQIVLGLYADGTTRLQAAFAIRVAFELGEGYTGYVLEPELALLRQLTPDTAVGLYVDPKFGYDGYNQLYYSAPGFAAEDGYIGTEIALKLSSDVTDRTRISGKLSAISFSGAENELSPLMREDDWSFAARIAVTYAIFQSDEMTDN